MGIKNHKQKRLQKTLDELEGIEWTEPDMNSYVVQTCHRLKKKPIGEFDIEELRIMISQQIGLFFLIPLALEKLEENPVAEGHFYPGDLLQSVLSVHDEMWKKHSEWKSRLLAILNSMPHIPEEVKPSVRQFKEHFS